MGLKRTGEFRKDAVHFALTSGLTCKQVADDLGIGMSTLNKWATVHRDTDVVPKEDLGLAQENDRLRRGEPHSQGGKGNSKKCHGVLREPKAVSGSVLNSVYLSRPMRVSDTVTH